MSISLLPTGVIIPFAGSSAPPGWSMCDGSALDKDDYSDLFAVIGVTYGDPGGNQFNIPNLQTRTPIGPGGGRSVGDTVGDETHTLALGEMPTHAHTGGSHTHSGGGHEHYITPLSYGFVPSAFPTSPPRAWNVTSGWFDPAVWTAGGGNHSHTGGNHVHDSTGGGGSHNNMQPSLVVNYLIKI